MGSQSPDMAGAEGSGGAAGSAAGSATGSQSGRSAAGSPERDKAKASEAGSDGAAVRTRESFERLMVERYQRREAADEAATTEQGKRVNELMQQVRDLAFDYQVLRSQNKAAAVFGGGYNGFGNGHTEEAKQPPVARIIYPFQRTRPGRRSTNAFKYTRKDMLKQAEQHEELVPLRLDAEWDKYKLRDTFTWNLHERLARVELFAAHLVEDMGLKPPADKPIYDQVVQQMHHQLNDFYPFVFSDDEALDPELPYSAYKNDEMRILVKLNITIGQHTLVDQFEWDINNPANSPEAFAALMARDLSLTGEFTTAIAHCIREQAQLFTKGLYGVGHPFDGRPVDDADLVAAFLQSPLPSIFRPQQQAKEYAPCIYELSETDLDRNEMVLSREQRPPAHHPHPHCLLGPARRRHHH
ncbi:hypothetical protein CDD81_4267 [Ophiocordyceps australis]|uniref:Uncharacterized protein n=1 Tax=Ophiocordyceps australis TaxID=1399860 RepID=A0A2C5XTU1_9HYPO|nr:hypothetical protein CDD81_4267 [Ophiocordyceps australis]